MDINFKLRDLLDAGMHLGHKTNKWNPNMEQYIYGSQDDIHIIDLRKTVLLLNNALTFIENIAKSKGSILFVGTKSQAIDIVKKYAIECKQFYVNKRWLGGMLTNWSTISNSLNSLNSLLSANRANISRTLYWPMFSGWKIQVRSLISYSGSIASISGKAFSLEILIIFTI